MAVQSLGIVLVRLFSIYLAINAFQTLVYFLPPMFSSNIGLVEGLLSASFWLMVFGIFVPAGCAYWLWQNVAFVVPQGDIPDEHEITVPTAMMLGVSLIGLWMLVWGLVSVVRVESSMQISQNLDDGLRLAQRAPYLAQIFISILLLFSRKRIVSMLLWAKYAGRKKN